MIRAAISLKLCHFEETGAIVAALTTSIPEAPGTERNWDYRFCWLRDAYFVIHALNRLGATKTMEGFLSYIENLAAGADGSLQPVYGIALEANLDERTEPALAGYRGMGPVRVGNQAYLQPQHDVYGSLVLASTHSFFDRRLLHRGGLRLFELLEALRRAAPRASGTSPTPDPGSSARARTSTPSRRRCAGRPATAWRRSRRGSASPRARPAGAPKPSASARESSARAWSEKRKSFVSTFDGEELDASLLLLHEIGFVAPDDPRFAGTVAAIEQRPAPRAVPAALRGGRRLRRAALGLQHLHVLVHRHARCARPSRRGARALREHARAQEPRSACCPRTSTLRRASSGATSRRPTRWSG